MPVLGGAMASIATIGVAVALAELTAVMDPIGRRSPNLALETHTVYFCGSIGKE